MEWKYHISDIDYGVEECRAVEEVINSKWLSMGEKTRQFEQDVSCFLGGPKTIAVSSCTSALHLALKVLDVKDDDEIIVPSYTFIATVNSILYQRAKPVFAEISGENDLNLDFSQLENLLTEKTRGIIPVHLAGYATDIDKIVDFARQNGLFVVEDAAHAIGSTYRGKHLGTFGDIGCYSFFSNKNLVTGEGGMVTTDNEELFERIKLLRTHGLCKTSWDKTKGASLSYDVFELGHNYRMTELNAALGICQLAKLKKNNGIRRELTEQYKNNLSGRPYVIVPFLDNPTHSSCHVFPVILDRSLNRDDVIEGLKERGVQTTIHYPPVHQFTLYANQFEVSLPKTEDISRREITLPLHPLLRKEDVDDICSIFNDVVTGN
ncbi:MAG: DegT/DnrJ/EryC1/StrS family aminotransferase [Nanoarchaeota archaeon]|nr:DegT/DnrJ/EryC1/StrS family aminotransferase [Nanoarchaeota archaeon]MBU1623165.1 DegT/DnrJ/EryC1/StrS family aminotransferase [Nanoarchaeota archaeon]